MHSNRIDRFRPIICIAILLIIAGIPFASAIDSYWLNLTPVGNNHLGRVANGETLSSMITSAGTDFASGTDTRNATLIANATQSGRYSGLYRSIWIWDTSQLPANITINSIYLSYYPTIKEIGLGETDLYITNGSAANSRSTNPVTDFSRGGEVIFGRIPSSAWNSSAFYTMDITANATPFINRTGDTVMFGKLGWDQIRNFNGTWTAGARTTYGLASRSSSHPPTLKISYSFNSSNAPIANFTGSPTSGNASLAVQFTDTSTGNPNTWNWNFGDGTSNATVQNPGHTYTSPGTFTVSLTATNSSIGSGYVQKMNFITVSAPSQGNSWLNLTPVGNNHLGRVTTGETLSTIITSAGTDFASGTDTRNATLVADASQSSRYSGLYRSIWIWNTSQLPPNVTISGIYLSYYPTMKEIGLGETDVYITNGSAANSRSTNPVTDFSRRGEVIFGRIPSSAWSSSSFYTLNITANATSFINRTGDTVMFGKLGWDQLRNFNGTWIAGARTSYGLASRSSSHPPMLNISYSSGSITAPVANFTGSPTSGNASLTVQFTDTSINNPNIWNWNFGDNSTSTAQNPSHSYSSPGAYDVLLTAGNTAGNNTLTKPDYISVTSQPSASITVTSPDGGENWLVSTTPTLHWTSNGSVGSYVKIDLLKAGSIVLNISASTPNDGTFTSWTIPSGQATGTDYRLKIASTSNPAIYDTSNSDFTISATAAPTITVTSPNGGETWVNGTNPTIHWSSVGSVGSCVKIDVLKAGSIVQNISASTPNDGTFTSWTVPSTMITGTDYRLKIESTSDPAINDLSDDTFTIYGNSGSQTYDADIIFSSMPTTMFAGEHYLVDIKMNNTGSALWSGDNTSPNLVFLQGLGGVNGEAAKFNITHIPMIFQNETVAFNESYDFFFYVHAPETLGNYTPEYRVSSANIGDFGEISNNTVRVITNPFHPVVLTNGTKLYTTTFGNTSSGISVDIVGTKVYIDNSQISNFQDPRFLINPTLKSGIFDFGLNDTYSYANISITYDPAKVSNPAYLTMSYFNEITGNYTYVPSTVDTVNHKVTSQVSHSSSSQATSAKYEVLDGVQYHSLPAEAQNEMGTIDYGPNYNWTVHDYDLQTPHTTWFNGAQNYPPGNYTIVPSGYYTHIYSQYCTFEFYAYQNYYATGPYVSYTGPSGSVSSSVSSLVVPGNNLKFTHYGGPIGIRIVQVSERPCGDLTYKLFHDPLAISDDELTYSKDLNNDAFNATTTGYDLAVFAYQAAAGCVLGQAGVKGGFLDQNQESIPGYSSVMNNEIAESTAYMVGHVACAMVFPEVTLARDFAADIYRGDPIAVALDSLGYLGPVKNLLRTSDAIPVFLLKNCAHSNEASKLGKYLADGGLIGASHDEIVGTLDKVFYGSATRLYDSTKNSDNNLITAVKNKFDLSKVHSVINANGDTRVLTNEGIQHIIDRHGTGHDLGDGQKLTSFWPMGYEVRPGITTPNVMTQADVETLIVKCLKEGSSSIEPASKNLVYSWAPNQFGITQMEVYVVPSTGEIASSFPVEGPNVIKVW